MRLRRFGARVVVAFVWSTATIAEPLAAQDVAEEDATGQAIRVFLDCRAFRFCNRDFYRREIPYVNYTRDREDSEVHLLITSQATGGGGQSNDGR